MMLFKNLLLALPAVVLAQNAPSLQQLLTSNPDLSQLAGLVTSQPALLSSLGNATNITILAPNNAALGALLNSTQGQSLASVPGAIAALLQYHVLNGTYLSSAIPANRTTFVRTLLTNSSFTNVTTGQRVEVLKTGSSVSVISGLLQNSTVVTADQNFTGGTVHVINKVLTLPPKASDTLLDANLTAAWGALNATQLVGPVNNLKDVTIFAPNNNAFAAIGSILANASMDTLMSVLKYHVVNGSRPYYSSAITGNTSLSTLQGTNLTVMVNNGSVFVNNAKVIVPDVLIAGGVVHVIDEVINPANATAMPGASGGAVAFSGASSVTNTPFTSGVPSASATVGGGAGGVTGSSSSTAGGMPRNTGAAGMGAAALMGVVGAALLI